MERGLCDDGGQKRSQYVTYKVKNQGNSNDSWQEKMNVPAQEQGGRAPFSAFLFYLGPHRID